MSSVSLQLVSASQSSTYEEYTADKAIDGNTNGQIIEDG